MSAPFEKRIVVKEDAIDANGHVNNVVYVQWMQNVAYAHSASLGFDSDALARLGATWVVRSHSIHYRRPAVLSDVLIARTWVVAMKRVNAIRRYEFIRASDQKTIAEGETDWVYIDCANGRPRPIDAAMKAAFTEL